MRITGFSAEKTFAAADDASVGSEPRLSIESAAAGGPRLTVSIITKNSENRLERLLAEVSWIADQVVVGVDADSTDRTSEIAARFADVVFTFRKAGQMAGARMMIFDYAVGDWILVIDDDESLEPDFGPLLPELMSRPGATHYWFPRKWIVAEAPYAFAAAPPWYPDWQMRLFRNDRTMVWKPPRPHSGYHVLGAGYFEPRASILHFEPVWCSDASRREKLQSYRDNGASSDTETQYPAQITSPRRPATGPAMLEHHPRGTGGGVVHPDVRDADGVEIATWGAEILKVEMQAQAECAAPIVAEITVRNTGGLAWAPNFGERGARLNLGAHLLDSEGEMLTWEFGGRASVRDLVPPGAETTFFHTFSAPEEPGQFHVVWNMVSEGECWFPLDPLRPPLLSPLRVAPPPATEPSRADDRDFLETVTGSIPGWLGDYAALRTLDLMRWQTASGVVGPALEIGVYAGRYLSVLRRQASAAGDATIGLDIFDRVDEAQVRANLVGSDGVVDLIAGRSTEQSAESLRARLGAPARFISIDGSHLLEDVRHDLAICEAVLADKGVIACDDFLNPVRLGVGQAIHERLARGDGLAAFAYVQNKLFLCRPEAHRALFEAVMDFCAQDDQGPTGAGFVANVRLDPARNQTQLYGWDVAVAP